MYIKVDVTPEAKQNSIKRLSAEKFEISVKDKTEHNMANKKVLELLAGHLRVPEGNLRIISGHLAPHKIIHIRD